MTHTQHIGKRVLYSITGEPTKIIEARVLCESPSGKYLCLSYDWHLATQVNILEILPGKLSWEEPLEDQSDQSNPTNQTDLPANR